MGIRAKQLLSSTFSSTEVGRLFAAQAIAGSKIANGDITGAQLATSVAGNGLTGGGGSALAVAPDVTTGGGVSGLAVGANGVGISAAAAGNGIAGGAGVALSVNPDVTTGANTQPVAVVANGVGLDIAAIAGTGVEADGAANLRLAAQGNGIAGGAGATLSFDSAAALTLTGVHSHTPTTMQIVGSPAGANDGTNKAYVDSLINGQLWKPAAKLATAAALPAVTYSNGTGGVGATLTAGASGVLTIDGVATVLGDRLLVKNQVAGLQNGLYEVSTEGTAGVPFVLTRTTDSDNSPSNELEAAAVLSTDGTSNLGKTWVQTATTVTVGTTALVFVQSAGASAAAAGAGLAESGNVFNVGDVNKGVQVNVDDIEFSAAEAVQVAGGLKAGANAWELAIEPADFAGTGLEDDGADNLRLAAQGNGIAGGAGATLSVNPDVTTGANTQPVAVVANGVGLDIAAIAGTSLEADGAANLRLAAAAAGNGLTGGGAAALSVQPDTVATADATALVVGATGTSINGDLISIDETLSNITPDTGGLGADVKDLAAIILGIDNALATTNTAILTAADKALVSGVTSGDGSTTGKTISGTPLGWVGIHINGILYELGSSVKTKACYFSVDGGTTARAMAAITAADTLYWNGVIVGFDLDASDIIDMVYET